jgi:hypothetical protein
MRIRSGYISRVPQAAVLPIQKTWIYGERLMNDNKYHEQLRLW